MKKLTKAQKKKNKALYKAIRREWKRTDKSISYKDFKRIVIDWTKGGKYNSIREGAKIYAHSRQFVDAETVGKENLLAGLKKEFPDVYKELRSKMGRFDKDQRMIDKLEWDANKQMYTFRNGKNQYWVDITNSPKGAFII